MAEVAKAPPDNPKPFLLPGDTVSVTVVSALPDVIIVTFNVGCRIFEGALLDSTKRGLPCGVTLPKEIKGDDEDDHEKEPEKLSTIASRFTYFQERKCPAPGLPDHKHRKLRRSINPPARYKHAKPTVRLRPRQVLCSKCGSICQENGENVVVSGKKMDIDKKSIVEKAVEVAKKPRMNGDVEDVTNEQSSGPKRRSTRNRVVEPTTSSSSKPRGRAPIQKFQSSNSKSCKTAASSDLHSVSVIRGLPNNDGEKTSRCWNGNGRIQTPARSKNEPIEVIDLESNTTTAYCGTPRRLSSSSVESAKIPGEDQEDYENDNEKKPIFKSRSLKRRGSSMADISKVKKRNTPIIKICYGTEGTVLKIQPKPRNTMNGGDVQETYVNDVEEVDPLEIVDLTESKDDLMDVDSAFEVDEDDEEEEEEDEDEEEKTDPLLLEKDASTKAAKRALKKAKKEARRKMLGTLSPCNSSPRYSQSYNPLSYHRRKHKVKHKKKHKEERKHRNSGNEDENRKWNVLPNEDTYTAIKEQCLKQKLSISLKRLNTNAYAKCDYPVSNASSGCKSPGASSDELSEHEPGVEVEVEVEPEETAPPDFPPPAHPLVMHLAATPVPHCLTASGRRMDVGDIVWGKIHGFPWWPGKVLSINVSRKEDEASLGPQAHVAWYGSSTSSLMSCDQLSPFLETFKTRFNKKKRGPYKEAIRQAQSEAQRSQVGTSDEILDVCGSPREVNVAS